MTQSLAQIPDRMTTNHFFILTPLQTGISFTHFLFCVPLMRLNAGIQTRWISPLHRTGLLALLLP